MKRQTLHVGKTYKPVIQGLELVLIEAFPGIPRGMRGADIRIVPTDKEAVILVQVMEKRARVRYFGGDGKLRNETNFFVAKNQYGLYSVPKIVLEVGGEPQEFSYPVKAVPRPRLEDVFDDLPGTFIVPHGDGDLDVSGQHHALPTSPPVKPEKSLQSVSSSFHHGDEPAYAGDVKLTPNPNSEPE